MNETKEALGPIGKPGSPGERRVIAAIRSGSRDLIQVTRHDWLEFADAHEHALHAVLIVGNALAPDLDPGEGATGQWAAYMQGVCDRAIALDDQYADLVAVLMRVRVRKEGDDSSDAITIAQAAGEVVDELVEARATIERLRATVAQLREGA